MASKPHALMAGGGTAGHVFPGVAVAVELERRGWRVSWAGCAGGMEERLVASRDLPFHPLAARAVVGRGPLARVKALLTLGASAVAARRLVRRLDVRVVLGTGGYVSAPAVLGARLAGRPAVLLEPNARAGAANRLLSRWAQAAAIAYEAAGRDFRCPTHLTGVPVRPEFFELAAPATGGSRVLVLGGSQGALNVNLLLPAVFELLAARYPHLAVTHQVGRHADATREAYASRELGAATLEIVPFIEDVAGAMAGAELVLSRAGAVTVAEICAARRPAVLMPLALAAGHQRDNARALVDAGGAVIVDEASPPAEIAATIDRLLGDPPGRAAMSAALGKLARPDAAPRIADLVVAAATAGRGSR